jgi:hypothetical protein
MGAIRRAVRFQSLRVPTRIAQSKPSPCRRNDRYNCNTDEGADVVALAAQARVPNAWDRRIPGRTAICRADRPPAGSCFAQDRFPCRPGRHGRGTSRPLRGVRSHGRPHQKLDTKLRFKPDQPMAGDGFDAPSQRATGDTPSASATSTNVPRSSRCNMSWVAQDRKLDAKHRLISPASSESLADKHRVVARPIGVASVNQN